VIKPIDFLLFFKYAHSINNSYFKSLTIVYGVVLVSLIMNNLNQLLVHKYHCTRIEENNVFLLAKM